ncbi:sensor histidine kinase [Actinomadura parmotrematis]|uniref:Two-component sensor histidine kinase n=1 Tax=Actinomadura parmotrematis TaxID=2864039 RepID=A0ABS7FXK2_9ACTN|nr:histidine kinase [Actinomadura parmotrematis]MBW8484885.1 two-component sensor histidine kinase [Actinomadura parmotrematis]
MQPRIPRPTVIAAIIVAMTALSLAGLLVPALWYEAVERSEAGRALLAAACAGGVLALHGRLLWLNLMRRTAPAHRWALAAITAVCWALPAVLGVAHGWGNALIVPAGLFAVVLPLRESMIVTPVAAVAAPLYGLALGLPVPSALYTAAAIPLYTFSGYVTVWFFHVVQELSEARAELARSAVGEERLRFARDLHDVLGHSLQAIALRAEVAERYLDRDPGRVRKELTEVQAMARDAVGDVREVVRGYRRTSLRTELDGMSAVLRAAGIACATPDVAGDLPAHVHEPLGWVAREAATNVLRHSAATRCEIMVRDAAGRIELEIVNDGAGRRGDEAGSGLAGLAERLAAVGGALAAGPAGGGTFRVVAAVPRGEP